MARVQGAVSLNHFVLGVTIAALAVGSAWAQSSSSSVTVDMSVLDELGPPAPGASDEAINLHPPPGRQAPAEQPASTPEPTAKPGSAPERQAATTTEPEAAEPEVPEAVAPEPEGQREPQGEPGSAPMPESDVGEPEAAPTPAPEAETASPEPARTAAAEEPTGSSAPAEESEESAAVSEPARQPSESEQPDVQSAALTPSDEGDPSLRIEFDEESSELPGDADAGLAEVVRLLAEDEDRRLVIYAYADGSEKTDSQARRLSLSRALAVRRYLVENGVRGTRAEIRALGQEAEDGPIDRVDLVVVER